MRAEIRAMEEKLEQSRMENENDRTPNPKKRKAPPATSTPNPKVNFYSSY